MWSVLSSCCMCFPTPDPEGLAPTAIPEEPTRPELAPYLGRWVAAVPTETGWASCAGASTFVELRGDGLGAWELVTGDGDLLRVLPIGRGVTETPERVTFQVDQEPADLVWIVPGQVANFPTLYLDRNFVAPSALAAMPAAPQGCR